MFNPWSLWSLECCQADPYHLEWWTWSPWRDFLINFKRTKSSSNKKMYSWDEQQYAHIRGPGWGSNICWNSGYLFQLICIRFASVRISISLKGSIMKLEKIYPCLWFDVETNAINMPYQEQHLVNNGNKFSYLYIEWLFPNTYWRHKIEAYWTNNRYSWRWAENWIRN